MAAGEETGVADARDEPPSRAKNLRSSATLPLPLLPSSLESEVLRFASLESPGWGRRYRFGVEELDPGGVAVGVLSAGSAVTIG